MSSMKRWRRPLTAAGEIGLFMVGSSWLKGAIMFKAGRQPAQSTRFICSRATLSPQAPPPAQRVRSSGGYGQGGVAPESAIALSAHANRKRAGEERQAKETAPQFRRADCDRRPEGP